MEEGRRGANAFIAPGPYPPNNNNKIIQW